MKRAWQMAAPHKPVIKRAKIGEAELGSFVKDLKGKIFFLGTVRGFRVLYPVLMNGTISRADNGPANLHEEIDIVSSGELGIKRVKWEPRKKRVGRK